MPSRSPPFLLAHSSMTAAVQKTIARGALVPCGTAPPAEGSWLIAFPSPRQLHPKPSLVPSPSREPCYGPILPDECTMLTPALRVTWLFQGHSTRLPDNLVWPVHVALPAEPCMCQGILGKSGELSYHALPWRIVGAFHTAQCILGRSGRVLGGWVCPTTLTCVEHGHTWIIMQGPVCNCIGGTSPSQI